MTGHDRRNQESEAVSADLPPAQELREYLECWRRPGGTLARNQLEALLAWEGTPAEERNDLEESLALTRQQVPTRTLAPNQRRGHVSWIERLRGLFRP